MSFSYLETSGWEGTWEEGVSVDTQSAAAGGSDSGRRSTT